MEKVKLVEEYSSCVFMGNKENKDINTKLLEEIRDLLKSIDVREHTNELFSETDSLIKKVDRRADDALNKIGSSFDRIHDKLFAFNNILIVAFLGLSKYPLDKPVFDLWLALLPILNLIFLMALEKFQMEIYRHQSSEKEWTEEDILKNTRMVEKQNLRSLVAIFVTVVIFIFLFISIMIY